MFPNDLPCPRENFPKVEIHRDSFMMWLPRFLKAVVMVWLSASSADKSVSKQTAKRLLRHPERPRRKVKWQASTKSDYERVFRMTEYQVLTQTWESSSG